MKTVKVLGSGCKNCQVTASLIETVAEEKGVAILLVKVTQPEEIMAYQVMRTPAVVIDEQVVHKGSVPAADQVETWFS